MSALVELDGVVKRFGDVIAVRRMDLQIQKGEFIAIMGPSGCGKTTTLRMLAGLDTPSEGEIRIAGRVMNTVPAHQRDTPMVWQSLALFPFLNVVENVEFGLKMRGVNAPERRRRAMDWLHRMEIGDFALRMVDTLSGGQRQRVALARSLVTEPEVLLLDEPLSALDAHLIIRMQAVLTKLQRELGITFIYVTHSQSEALAMADRVVIMNQGGVAQIGTPRDIYRAPANRFVAEFVGRNNIMTATVTHDGLQTDFSACSAPASAKLGDRLTLIVSADKVRLSREGSALQAPLTLISEEFIGSVVTLFFETAEGQEIKVQMQERALSDLNLGDGGPFYADWDLEDTHILPEDTQ